MNVYSNKQRWKRVLLVAAAVIVVATLWYSNDIAPVSYTHLTLPTICSV